MAGYEHFPEDLDKLTKARLISVVKLLMQQVREAETFSDDNVTMLDEAGEASAAQLLRDAKAQQDAHLRCLNEAAEIVARGGFWGDDVEILRKSAVVGCR